FYFQCVATAFRRFRRNVPEQIEFVLLARNSLQSAKQIVRVENCKSAGSFRECGKDLLIRRAGSRQLRNNRARLAQRIVRIVEGIPVTRRPRPRPPCPPATPGSAASPPPRPPATSASCTPRSAAAPSSSASARTAGTSTAGPAPTATAA